jgi:uncharacterized protein YqeY
MSLKEKINSEMKNAMRNKETAKRDTLRNILAAIKQIEVDERKELADNDIESIIMKYIKQREDAKQQFASGGRDDLVEKEEAEMELLRQYLPEPLDDNELEEIIRVIITDTGASSIKDMGKVMGAAKSRIGSRADGGRINRMAKSLLLAD